MFNSAQINEIENKLQVTLPLPYRELMLSYPFADDPNPDAWEMLGNAKIVIAENTAYRKEGFFGFEWPPHYLVIGGDGFGNLYFLDLSRGDETVFFADHEMTSSVNGIDIYQETSSLGEWITQMKEERAKADAEEKRYNDT